MSTLHLCTWRWGAKYGSEYVERLEAGLRRHLKQPYRFGVFSPQAEDEHLTMIKGCFARLRMFDPEWQQKNGMEPGDRIVCIDLDCVITGPLDLLFNRIDNFTILTGANAVNKCPYNGSLWMLRAGYRPDVWSEFSLEAATKIPFHEFPDDQGWFAERMPGVTGWRAGPQSGVYAFHKPGWPLGNDLPHDARMVVFPGWRDPSKFTQLPWVKEHWTA